MKVRTDAGVEFIYNTRVIDMDFAESKGITVTGLHTEGAGTAGYIQLREGDYVIATLCCITDNATVGTKDQAAELDTSYPKMQNFGRISLPRRMGWVIWKCSSLIQTSRNG